MLKSSLKCATSFCFAFIGLSVGLSGHAFAEVTKPAHYSLYYFDIKAKNTAQALNEFAFQAKIQLLFPYDIAQKHHSIALKGQFTREEALKRLLKGTNFEVATHKNTVISLREKTPPIVKASFSQPQSPSITQADPVQTLPVSNPVAKNAEPESEVVVITGSRLKRRGFDSPVPLISLGSEQLSEEGHMDLGESLSEIPGISLDNALTNNQSSTQTNGISTVSLRGMGANRTLTLIDGRRTVSNAGNTNVVSLSTIPSAFVKRVEVITGGASAVYGSDAVTGVVNIITIDKYDGLKLGYERGTTRDGGAGSQEWSLLTGTSFFNKKLQLMFAANYDVQDGLLASERALALRNQSYSQSTNLVSEPDLSGNTFGGVFRTSTSSTATRYYFDETGSQTLKTGFVTALHGLDSRPHATLLTPRQSENLAFQASYDFGNDLKLEAKLLYSGIQTDTTRFIQSATSTTTYGSLDQFSVGRINKTNPYLAKFPTMQTPTSSTSGLIWARRFQEVGVITVDNHRETIRAIIDFKGKTAFKDWTWDLGYSAGSYLQTQYRENGINYENLSFAVKATTVDGKIVCLDPVARANGCVPINMFGAGAISPEQANYIRADAYFKNKNTQQSFTGNLTGTLFELPAGPVEAAFGFEVRKDTTKVITDELTERAVSNFAYIPRYEDEINAEEIYAEVAFPLLRDLPLAYRLNVDAAVRSATYDLQGVKNTLSYRLGAQYSPIKALKFRASLSRAQRAPNISEVSSPPRDDSDSVTDPCDGVTATTTGTIATNCRLIPGISAEIAALGFFDQDTTTVNGPNSGNPKVGEETGDSFTMGLVYRSKLIKGLNLSLDYYDIKVKGVISTLSNAVLLNSCYSDPKGPTNSFCSFITRNAEGQLVRIVNQVENLDERSTKGVDVALDYQFNLKKFKIPGQFETRLLYNHTYVLEQKFQELGGIGVEKYAGEVGNPKDKVSTRLGWTNEGLSLRWTSYSQSSVVDSNERLEDAIARGTQNPLFLFIDDFTRHDLSFSFKPNELKSVKFYGSIRNLYDKKGPYLPSGTDSGNSNNYAAEYPYERTINFGISLTY